MTGIPSIPPHHIHDESVLPHNQVSWEVDPLRAVLLVHDMQRYFLAPFAEDAEPRNHLVHNVRRLILAARRAGVPVAYTAQPGDMTVAQRGLLTDFWGPGMRATESDRAIVAPLAPRPGDWIFTKWRYSAFFGSGLGERLRAAGRDQLVVCGVYAHVGVLMTAVDAFTNDIQPFMVADAVADFSAEYHRMALDYAAARCAMVVPTAQVVSSVEGPHAAAAVRGAAS